MNAGSFCIYRIRYHSQILVNLLFVAAVDSYYSHFNHLKPTTFALFGGQSFEAMDDQDIFALQREYDGLKTADHRRDVLMQVSNITPLVASFPL